MQGKETRNHSHPIQPCCTWRHKKRKGWDDFWTWQRGTSSHGSEIRLNASIDNFNRNINVELTSGTPGCSNPMGIQPNQTAIEDTGASVPPKSPPLQL